MKKITKVVLLFLFSPLTWADLCQPLPLDKVAFKVSAKQWVSTQNALLIININATLNDADLIKARADIMANLNKIAAGDWHLTQFERSQDSSGLEKLFVEGQARIAQSDLTTIYQKAKSVSSPGRAYTISSIEFKPSLEEIQQVKGQIRERLYQLVNEEMTRLNKVYTNQHYTLNNLYVTEGEVVALPQPKAYQAKATLDMVATSSAPNLAVSNEITMSATAEVASNRNVEQANCK